MRTGSIEPMNPIQCESSMSRTGLLQGCMAKSPATALLWVAEAVVTLPAIGSAMTVLYFLTLIMFVPFGQMNAIALAASLHRLKQLILLYSARPGLRDMLLMSRKALAAGCAFGQHRRLAPCRSQYVREPKRQNLPKRRRIGGKRSHDSWARLRKMPLLAVFSRKVGSTRCGGSDT